MDLDKVKEFFSKLDAHDLPSGGALLVGIILLFLVFKSGRAANRLLLFIVAIGLFAGAWWWHQNK